MIVAAIIILIGAGVALVFAIDKRAQVQGGQNKTSRNMTLFLLAVILLCALLYVIGPEQ